VATDGEIYTYNNRLNQINDSKKMSLLILRCRPAAFGRVRPSRSHSMPHFDERDSFILEDDRSEDTRSAPVCGRQIVPVRLERGLGRHQWRAHQAAGRVSQARSRPRLLPALLSFLDSLASKPLHRFRALCPCVTGVTTGQRMSHFFFP
jgi:hypothetical protein